jgi:hypothetical protein
LGDKEIVGAHTDRIFENSACDVIAFEWEFESKEEFLFDEFTKQTGWDGRRRFRNTCSSGRESSDYHLHLRWRITPPESLWVAMEFVKNRKSPEEDEEQPFAEDFISWFNKFAIKKAQTVDMYADFTFPVAPHRQLRFPLPMKAPVGPGQTEVTIDGISFSLSPPIGGVEKIWLTQGKEEVNIHLHAKKALELDSLNPGLEINHLAKMLESMFERTES